MGQARFQRYVTAFHYGNENVSGTPGKHDGLTQAWLGSSLQISPLEQLAFLEKLVRRQLPVSPNAYDMTGRITAVATIENGWEVHGKTGTGFSARCRWLERREPCLWLVCRLGIEGVPDHCVRAAHPR